MGNDKHIINAARVSFAQDDFEELKPRTDAQVLGLINFLARGMQSEDWFNTINDVMDGTMDVTKAKSLIHRLRHTPTHWVPFAHTAITIKCSAPVPIRTQCFKHKQGLVESEESRRYISTKPEFFMPTDFRAAPIGSIKQGSALAHVESDSWLDSYESHCVSAISMYQNMVDDGVCPEQARFVLPQGTIVNWVWTGNLYAYANFYLARSDSHAQKEVQLMAQEIDAILRPLFPKAWPALVDQ